MADAWGTLPCPAPACPHDSTNGAKIIFLPLPPPPFPMQQQLRSREAVIVRRAPLPLLLL